MNHDTYVGVIRTVDDLIRIFEDHPDERTRERMTALLTGIDAIHREGLERLLSRVRDLGGEELVERLADDPVVATLLGLYDFAKLDVPADEDATEEPVTGFVPLEEVRVGRTGTLGPEEDER